MVNATDESDGAGSRVFRPAGKSAVGSERWDERSAGGGEFGRASRTVRSSARTRPATVFLVVIVILRGRAVEAGGGR